MREIKFRAWDSENSQMLDEVIGHINSYEMLTGQDGYIPMQYTGLKDKNGKEIYEGDIIRFDSNGYGEGKIMAVEYDEQHTGFNPFCDQIFRAADNYSEWSIDSTEVIGNIYENPELVRRIT